MPDGSMSGKTCLITGGTAGIGLAAASELARRGAEVIVVGRNEDRCRAAVESIRKDASAGSAEYLRADLSARAGVRQVASAFLARRDRLDVLVNNVGALFALRSESADGIEMTLAVNHLAPFLLTNLLMEAMRASGSARIVNVSSDAHEMVKGFDFEDPQGRSGRLRGPGSDGRSELKSFLFAVGAPRRHPGLLRYAQSKLANLLFTYELARRLGGTSVTVNALHPGFVASSFTAGNGSYGWFMRRAASIAAISPEAGARTVVYLAASPEVASVSGKYFVKERAVESSRASYDEAAQRRLWELSEEMTSER